MNKSNYNSKIHYENHKFENSFDDQVEIGSGSFG